jgi:phosphate-selective porin OprO and OprP
MAGCDLR